MDLERFSRNILLNEIDIAGQERISNASVLCVGCGGLASFVLPLLVSNGVKQIGIVDFDIIESSNLPRQTMFTEEDIGWKKIEVAKKFLQKRNSNCKIEEIDGNHEMTKNCIDNYDVIIDLTDSRASRIFCNRLTLKHKKPFFTGAAQGFIGHIYSFANHLHHFPCYECLFSNDIVDEKTCSNAGVFPPIVEIVGGFITSNVLKYLFNKEINFNEFLFLDLLTSIRAIKMTKDSVCICSKY
ncbi:MAG: molybdopterin/thiamine biosynthesis adenylyltransferase [Candidatus Deianiraeaceae bacterium]|jgi:molybdopterin/thiamine biosynthesis adenylyltransferase